MESVGKATSRGNKIRNFYRIHNACSTLQEALDTIYNCGLDSEELYDLKNDDDEVLAAIGSSAAMNIAARMIDQKRKSLNLRKLYKDYDYSFENNIFKDKIKYPVVYDEDLENLAFTHKSLPNMSMTLTSMEKTQLSNERLEFLGDSWLGALVAYMLYNKFPHANEGYLSKMKDEIVSNTNLCEWSKQLDFDKKLIGNVVHFNTSVKGKIVKRFADCVEAYIGALIIGRFGNELNEVTNWLESLSSQKINNVLHDRRQTDYEKIAKSELFNILKHNKLGAALNYKRVTTTSPFIVEVRLGDLPLKTAEGYSVKEAEHKAAAKVLADVKMLQKYSSYEIIKNDPPHHQESSHKIRDLSKHSNKIEEKIGDLTTAYSQPKPSYEWPYTPEDTLEVCDSNSDVSNIGDSHESIPQDRDDMIELINKLINEKLQKGTLDAKKSDATNEKSGHTNTNKKVTEPNKTEKITSNTPATCDKTAKQTLYTKLSQNQLFPEYITNEISANNFHTSCVIKGTNALLGKGTGRSKKISQHKAAENALHGTLLSKYLKKGAATE